MKQLNSSTFTKIKLNQFKEFHKVFKNEANEFSNFNQKV